MPFFSFLRRHRRQRSAQSALLRTENEQPSPAPSSPYVSLPARPQTRAMSQAEEERIMGECSYLGRVDDVFIPPNYPRR